MTQSGINIQGINIQGIIKESELAQSQVNKMDKGTAAAAASTSERGAEPFSSSKKLQESLFLHTAGSSESSLGTQSKCKRQPC